MADGRVHSSATYAEVVVTLGSYRLRQTCLILPGGRWDVLLGMDFLTSHNVISGISFNPNRLVLSNGEEHQLQSSLSFQSLFRIHTESYQLLPILKRQSLRALMITPDEVPVWNTHLHFEWDPDLKLEWLTCCSVDLFSTPSNNNEELYITRQLNAFKFDWKDFAIPYANPPWSKLAHTLHKVVLDRCKLVMVHPLWAKESWWPLLEALTVRTYQLGDEPLYIPDNSSTPLPKPRWDSCVTFLDGSLIDIESNGELLNPCITK